MRFVLAFLFSCSLIAGMAGCGCREDPRDAPGFRHDSLQDPSIAAEPPGSARERAPTHEAPDE